MPTACSLLYTLAMSDRSTECLLLTPVNHTRTLVTSILLLRTARSSPSPSLPPLPFPNREGVVEIRRNIAGHIKQSTSSGLPHTLPVRSGAGRGGASGVGCRGHRAARGVCRACRDAPRAPRSGTARRNSPEAGRNPSGTGAEPGRNLAEPGGYRGRGGGGRSAGRHAQTLSLRRCRTAAARVSRRGDTFRRPPQEDPSSPPSPSEAAVMTAGRRWGGGLKITR